MENITVWIEHLNKPLVLSGFVLFVLSGLVKLLNPEKLSSKAAERLTNRAISFTFVLGFMIVMLAFVKSFMSLPNSFASSTTIAQPHVIQQTAGSQSPAISSAGNVNIQYEKSSLPQQEKAVSDSQCGSSA